MKKSTHNANLGSTNARSEMCWICLQNFPDVALQPCKHVFCSTCIKKLGEVDPNQVPISLDILSLEERRGNYQPFEADCITWDCCPICNKHYSKITENQFGKSILRNRLFDLVGEN
jgi:hypothetical protein